MDELDKLIEGIPDNRLREPLKVLALRVKTMEENVEQYLSTEQLFEEKLSKNETPIASFL